MKSMIFFFYIFFLSSRTIIRRGICGEQKDVGLCISLLDEQMRVCGVADEGYFPLLLHSAESMGVRLSNRSLIYFQHLHKCGGSTVCSIMMDSLDANLLNNRWDDNCRSPLQNGYFIEHLGGFESNRLSLSEQQQTVKSMRKRALFVANELTMNASPILCPGSVVYLTSLRDPRSRSQSLYGHFRQWFGQWPGTFELWALDDRFRFYNSNYMTRALSGECGSLPHSDCPPHALAVAMFRLINMFSAIFVMDPPSSTPHRAELPPFNQQIVSFFRDRFNWPGVRVLPTTIHAGTHQKTKETPVSNGNQTFESAWRARNTMDLLLFNFFAQKFRETGPLSPISPNQACKMFIS